MGGFNNRELASAVWLLMLVAFAMRKSDVRRSFGSLAESFFNRHILGGLLAMLMYSAGIVYILYTVDIWKRDLIKDTILWFCFTAFVLTGSAVTRNDGAILKKVARESLKIILIFEFLVNEYTFSLPLELIIVPIAAVVAIMHIMAQREERYSAVAKLTGGIQILIGLFLVVSATHRAVKGFEQLATVEAFRKFLLAPVLTLMFIPFLFLSMLYSSYEQMFVLLKVGRPKHDRVLRYAKSRLINEFWLNTPAIHRFRKANAWDLTRAQTEADVDEVLRSWRTADARN